jgi:hypothetical protein
MDRVRILRQPFALAGLPIAFALAGTKADERNVLLAIFTAEPDLTTTRPGQALIGDKKYYGAAFETALAGTGVKLLRPARQSEPPPVLQRILALTAAIWHNDTTSQPTLRSLIAYDH